MFEESRGPTHEAGARASASTFSLGSLFDTALKLIQSEVPPAARYVYWAFHHYGLGSVVRRMPENYFGKMVWNAYREVAPKIVQCQSCERRFRSAVPIFGHVTQGIDCACSIFFTECEPCGTGKHYYLEGAYGSSHFDSFDVEFAFAKAPPERLLKKGIPLDPICDECVQKMIDDGTLVEVKNHFPTFPAA